MKNEYCCNMSDLLNLFTDDLSASDLLASKALGEISAAVVKQRLELGMTQKQFAQYMNVSQGMVSKWESSDYNFSVKALAEIAAKLDLDLNIHLHKSKVIQVSQEPQKISRITAMERRFFVFNNKNYQGQKKHCFKQYIDDSNILVM